MGRGTVFHFSFYLTLALAAVCLGFAEMFFLTWMPWYLGSLAILVALAWKYEGRWQLSEPGANSIGLVIAFGMLGWIVFQLPRNEEELLAAGVPWPAGLLPHFGPLLMILTAVKLFRPKKIPDFWVLQILGIMMVTLASVLAGEMDHGVWVFLYLVSLVWCLIHFHRMQSAWAGLSDDARRATPLFPAETMATAGGPRTFGFDGLGWAVIWSVMIVGLGAGLFVFAPRYANVQWVPHKLSAATSGRMLTGLEAGMDLNRTGKIELSDEVAFEVATQDSEGRAVVLPATIYWRGETLDFYQKGRWFSGSQTSELWPDFPGTQDVAADSVRLKILSVPNAESSPPPSLPPEMMATGQTYLTIRMMPGMAGALVAAEPVDIDLDLGRSPHIGERPSRSGIFAYVDGADTIVAVPQTRRTGYTYGQVVDLTARPTMQPARRIQPRYLQAFLTQPPPDELVSWSRALLQRQNDLTEAERTLGDDNRVARNDHARVARSLSRHFASAGEYLYSLNLRRVDPTIDPNVDFLLNVKEGHCERYASGLALTLRALGIPCRIVHGFRGVETTDDGLVMVRFNQAHSWVQALTPRADGEGDEWLLLDPTPSQEAALDRWQAFVEWLGGNVRAARAAFRNGVLDYGSDQQKARLATWWAGTVEIVNDRAAVEAGGVLGIVLISFAGWRWGRTPLGRWWQARLAARHDRSRMPWLSEALAMIDTKTGRTPSPHQTLLEFAASLREGSTMALSDAFDQIALFANQVRFGQRPLTLGEEREVAAAMAQLRDALDSARAETAAS